MKMATYIVKLLIGWAFAVSGLVMFGFTFNQAMSLVSAGYGFISIWDAVTGK